MRSTLDCDLHTVVEEDDSESRTSPKLSKNSYNNAYQNSGTGSSSDLILNAHTLPLASCESASCTLTTPKDARKDTYSINRVTTPSDQTSNSSITGSTDDSFLSSEDDRYFERESRLVGFNANTVAVSSCRSSIRSSGRHATASLECSVQEVSTPGSYGEVTVENSSEVHFGNKIYTAPITVVNHLGYPEDAEFATGDKDAWKDPFERPNCLRRPRRPAPTSRWRLPLAVTSVVVITVASALATVFVVLGGWPSGGTDSVSEDILINASWFYTRDEWEAKPPRDVTRQKLPVPYVLVEHTATPACNTYESCVGELIRIQTMHMVTEHNWSDIGYNYLVGGDGGVYEGRGANAVGAHAGEYNWKSLGIAFVGNYDTVVPTELQLEHLAELIAEAVRQGKVMENYQLFGHCQVRSLRSPGKILMEEVRKMPFWNSTKDCSL